ncbi:MAG: radical SAM family heme chaperone HemW [Thermodesulfobacteriota bacterium]
MQQQNAGLYIHVPFCVRKCPYCDFFSVTDPGKVPAFVEALVAEMAMHRSTGLVFDTIYLGGGTPTVIDADTVLRIVDAAHRTFAVAKGAEITIEANPGTVCPDQLTAFRKAGINRINIGVQSFDDKNLAFLGRIHSAAESEGALDMAEQAGFDNIGIDLIYGLPGQDPQNWQKELTSAVLRKPDHIACYLLTFEPGTPMDDQRRAGRFLPLSDDQQAALYEQAAATLADAGYDHYEISNFAAADNRRSRHNRKYWTNAPYIGLGPAAHSYQEPVRSWNCSALDPYLRKIENGMLPVADTEVLTRRQQMIETVYLGLRRREGICVADFEQRFEVDFNEVFGAAITPAMRSDNLYFDQRWCRLTPRGRLRLDGIAAHLVEWI